MDVRFVGLLFVICLCLTTTLSKSRCPYGWVNFRNTCYYFGHEQGTFAEANRKCQQMYGQPVEVENEGEWVFLKTEAEKKCRCAYGWVDFRNTCYYFGHEQGTFAEANKKCQQMHGQLVEIENEDEYVFLKTEAEKKSLDFWIGLTDAFQEGDWSWINTWRTPSFTDWAHRQPNNHNSNEHCVHMSKVNQYQWNDLPCDSPLGYICEV